MSGIEGSDTEVNTDTVPCKRTLAIVLIVLLLSSPGFLMIFVETSGLNPVVVLAMWILVIAVILLFVRHIRFMRSMSGSSGKDEDAAILARMRRHASQARRTMDPGKFCCSYCETVFDLMNAVPVETDVFLCPKCGGRLLLE